MRVRPLSNAEVRTSVRVASDGTSESRSVRAFVCRNSAHAVTIRDRIPHASAPRSAAAPRPSQERISTTPRRSSASAGVGGSATVDGVHPRRTRATVRCGRNRRSSRSHPSSSSASQTVACSAASTPVVIGDRHRQHVRPARCEPQRRTRRQRRQRPPRQLLHHRAQRPDVLQRPVAEEGQRQVDLLGARRSAAPGRRPPPRAPRPPARDGPHRRAPARRRGARARPLSPRSRLASSAPHQVHGHGRRAVADVEAAAGQATPARRAAAVRRARPRSRRVPTGLSSVPPPGPATPVMPTPTSAPSAARAPSASASATSTETAPHALDQRRRRRPPARPSPRWSRRPARRARSPTSPPGRSAARPAARRCTTRRWRSCAPRSRSSAATCSSTDVPSSENSVSAWRSRHQPPRTRRRPPAAAARSA